MHSDSIDKIVTSYFACVSKDDFVYKKKRYTAKPLKITELLFRGYECPENCAGCCPVFSLDYLPTETHPQGLNKREVILNDVKVPVYSDLQVNNKTIKCKNVNYRNGRCKIHGKQPFSCDFELIRTLMYRDAKKPNVMLTRLFGRGWALTKIDGSKGALCVIGTIRDKSVKDIKRKITRLNQWCDHFKINSHCPDILKWIEQGNVYSVTKIFGELQNGKRRIGCLR